MTGAGRQDDPHARPPEGAGGEPQDPASGAPRQEALSSVKPPSSPPQERPSHYAHSAQAPSAGHEDGPPPRAWRRSIYDTGPEATRLDAELSSIWASGRGWQRLAAVNHSVIGIRFIVTALVFFGIGGFLAMLIRAQLASPRSPFMEPGLYAQVFTMHGTIMMFLFAIPLFEGFAMYFLPKMLGARDMAFPRLSAYGYWCYLFGGLTLVGALVAGVAPDSGWFMYTPLSSRPFTPGINADVWLLGVTFVEISAMTAAVEILVTILKIRAPGMSLERLPVMAWYLLVVAAMMLLGFPPLILGSLLLEAERAFGLPFFDPARGGDPLLWQHLFWLFGHPEVYIIFLPAAGALATLVPVFAGRPLAGRRMVIAAVVAMAFLSFGLWVHHMFTTGLPHLSLAFFSAASVLVAVPTGVQIFALLATLAAGRPRMDLPMLHVCGFFFVFTIGGLTGVMLAVVPFDWQAHDTHFVVAHLHYVLVGGFLFPMMAAGYYWWPALTGREAAGRLARPAFWMIFLGFNLTFFMMHLTGLLGMPRRVDSYPEGMGWEVWNLLSSLGSFVMAGGFAVLALDLVLMWRYGRRTGPDPWRAGTLDWAVGRLPAPSYNFASLPAVDADGDRHSPRTLGPALARGAGFLGATRHGWMETLGVSLVDGRPEHVLILPVQTFLPFITALATAGIFGGLLAGLYPLAAAAAVVTVWCFLLWGRREDFRRDLGPLSIGHGIALPAQIEMPRPPAYSGLVAALAGDAAAFGSLLFGGLFLWLSAGWAEGILPAPPPRLAGMAAAGLLIGAAAAGWAERGLRPLALIVAALGQAGAIAALALIAAGLPPAASHAAPAVAAAVLAYAGVHAAIGLVFALFGLWRLRAGYVSAARRTDLAVGRLWARASAMIGIIGLGYLMALAALNGGAG